MLYSENMHNAFRYSCEHQLKSSKPVVVGRDGSGVLADVPKRMAIALFVVLVFVHSVLKWLHHPLLNNVMLLHPESFSHDFLHAAMSETLPGD